MTYDLNDPALQAIIAQAVAAALANQRAHAPAPAPIQSNTNNPLTQPLPPIPEITLLQATFFDNWPDGVKVKNVHRYKMTLEVWDDDADDIRLSQWTAKSSTVLIEYWLFPDRIKTLLARGTISQEYHDEMYNSWKRAEPPMNSPQSVWFGLLGHKGDKKGTGKKGTVYYDQQYIVVGMENKKAIWVILFVNGNSLNITGFVPTDMKGKPLSGNAELQARKDLCKYDDTWATDKPD